MKDLGECIRHPGEPALFRCRQCHDAVCVGCRAPAERDLCSTCGEYRQESAAREARVLAGEEVDEAPRPFPWTRVVIAILVAVNIGLAGYLALTLQQDAEISRGMEAAASLSQAVSESRDASGRYPATLETVLPRLPGPVVELVRAGVVRYEPNEDRTDYEVALALGRP
ncbi:MAG: B-box zinc finger protein [Candidatus Rokuibacteriota bacterium]